MRMRIRKRKRVHVRSCNRQLTMLDCLTFPRADPNVHPQVEEYWGNVNPIGIRCPSTLLQSRLLLTYIVEHLC